MLYGAGAKDVLGTTGVLLSSAIIFSGAVQFALVGLLLASASGITIFATAVLLNARNVVLGAALRPKIDAPLLRRLGLSWWLVDEAAALALADDVDPRFTLLLSGILFYGVWFVGSAVGLAIGATEQVASAADQIVPVLFIGLTALLTTSRSIAYRCVAAAALTYGLILVTPGNEGLFALVTGVAVALPGRAE